MLSQVLFGEKYEILDEIGHWLKIATQFDNYSGWIDLNHLQHTEIHDDAPGQVLNRSLPCFKSDHTRIILEAGCEIFNPDFKEKSFTVGRNVYQTIKEFDNQYITSTDSLGDTAMKFMNSPYIWGGRIPSGIDCSGFTQLVYKIHGKPIPRDSWIQAETGEGVNFIEETQPGDLVFFDNDRGRISHVGMIISRGLIIHASGRVRIDPVDHQGIFSKESEKYSHHLRMIKRIV
jgi:cell wall-associated NlpC family hydrolase